jgi:hypothetical protein
VAVELIPGVEFHEIGQAAVPLVEHLFDEPEGIVGLLLDVAGRDGLRVGRQRDLPADEKKVIGLPALGERNRHAPIPMVCRHETLLFHPFSPFYSLVQCACSGRHLLLFVRATEKATYDAANLAHGVVGCRDLDELVGRLIHLAVDLNRSIDGGALDPWISRGPLGQFPHDRPEDRHALFS